MTIAKLWESCLPDHGGSQNSRSVYCHIIGASVSEPPLVDSTNALSCTILNYIDLRRRPAVRSPLLRMRGATRKRRPAGLGMDSVQLSHHFCVPILYSYDDDDLGLQTRGRRAFPASAR